MSLYWRQTVIFKIESEATDPIEIRLRVRQGCIQLPILFNFYSEYIFIEVFYEVEKDVSINGMRLSNLHSAEDTIVSVDTVKGLKILMNRITETSSRYILDINSKKINKFMIISKKNIIGVHISINQTRMKRVHRY